MSVMNTKEFYEKNFDESQRLTGGDNRHLVEFERKKSLYRRMIAETNPEVILQIACGTGVLTDWICETYPNIKVIATDLVDKHIDSLKDHDNLVERLVWDCSGEVPDFDYRIDMVLVEGAWYHLNDRTKLINNLNKIGADTIIIDWLSAWHDATQQLLKNKKMPADYKNPRPDEPFVFDSEDDIETVKKIEGYNIKLYPVDMNTRFGYNDFNKVSKEQFDEYIEQLNKTIGLYDIEQAFIMNATEHGCYVLTKETTRSKYNGFEEMHQRVWNKYGKNKCRFCGGTKDVCIVHHFHTVRPYWAESKQNVPYGLLYADSDGLFPVCKQCRESGVLDTYRKALTIQCKKTCEKYNIPCYRCPNEIAKMLVETMDKKEIKVNEDAVYIGEHRYEKIHK